MSATRVPTNRAAGAAVRRLSLLARAGALVGTTLDDEATLRGLADLLVPDVADFCVIDLLEPDGSVHRVAADHVDPAVAPLMAEAMADPPHLGGAGDIAAALRDGQPRLIDPVDREVAWSARDPVRAARLRILELRSIMVVPLVGRDGVLAAMTVGASVSGRRYDSDDLEFAVELARRAAAAIDNVRLYRALQRLAESERSLSAELRAVIGAIGDGVLVFAPDGQLALANPAAAVLLDRAPRDASGLLARLEDDHGKRPELVDLIERGHVEARLLPPSEPSATAPRAQEGAGTAAAGPTPGGQTVAPRRWVEVTAHRFAPADATTVEGTETLVLIRDVTGARERRLTREAFFGVLSHELRTPVTTIYGNSKLLARAARRSRQVQTAALLDIESEAERLYRLVEDLLVLGRFEEGPLPGVARDPVLLQRLAGPIITAEASRRPDLQFESRLPADLPPVRGETGYVEQVLRNLIGNAAKYSAQGTVTVQAEPCPDGVEVRVLDEGPGLEEADVARLFELFYRAPHTALIAPGAGIGLFVSKRLVEAMGGRIWARARTDRHGAEFGFTLDPFTEEEA
jgi:signal transduction histidine kinase